MGRDGEVLKRGRIRDSAALDGLSDDLSMVEEKANVVLALLFLSTKMNAPQAALACIFFLSLLLGKIFGRMIG